MGKFLFFVHVRSAFGVGGKTPTPASDQKSLHIIQDEILYLTNHRNVYDLLLADEHEVLIMNEERPVGLESCWQ